LQTPPVSSPNATFWWKKKCHTEQIDLPANASMQSESPIKKQNENAG
jgi:hypothetical protein